MAKIEALAQAMSTASRSREGAGDHTAEEVRAFLQRRVAGFALLISLVFAAFLVWRLVATIASASEREGGTTYVFFQAAAVAATAALWLYLRGRPRRLRAVRIAEAVGYAADCAFLTMMAIYIPYSARPDIIMVQAFTLFLVGRSIYVPSSPRQTALIGCLLALVVVPAAYVIGMRGFDPALFAPDSGPAHARRVDVAFGSAVVAALWWAAAVVLASAASKVIYGLRKEVRDARRLGQYTLHEKLGSGGMGEVYRASHALLRRPAAIKLLPPEKVGEESIARFEREVQLTALLTHPNTVRVFDYGRTPGRVFYYAMELLDGGSLVQLVALVGPLPPGRVIHILEQCAGALAEAHGVGLIHRDIKPGNILLVEQGGMADVVKVVDFGLVKTVAGGVAPHTLESVSHADAIAGTPQYMAPEAITDPAKVDARTDLYALGAVGYFLLTGTEVFSGRSLLEVCSHHLQSDPVPPSGRLGRPLPADLEQLVLACLAKAPAERPASARALRAALLACADAGAWSEEAAAAWWRDNGSALRARAPVPGDVGSATTIAIDLDRRAG